MGDVLEERGSSVLSVRAVRLSLDEINCNLPLKT